MRKIKLPGGYTSTKRRSEKLWLGSIGQDLLHVDATPDPGYPLRILRAYRELCDAIWSDTTSGPDPSGPENPMFKLMNQHQEQRARLLDRAIAILKETAEQCCESYPDKQKTGWSICIRNIAHTGPHRDWAGSWWPRPHKLKKKESTTVS